MIFNAYHPIEELKEIMDVPDWTKLEPMELRDFLENESISRNRIIGDYVKMRISMEKVRPLIILVQPVQSFS